MAEYKYGPLGRGIEKRVTKGGAISVRRYLYHDEDILAEYDAGGNVTTTNTHGPGIDESLARVDYANGTIRYYLPARW